MKNLLKEEIIYFIIICKTIKTYGNLFVFFILEANYSIVTPQTKKGESLPASRRRPTMQVKALTRSEIAEKYDRRIRNSRIPGKK